MGFTANAKRALFTPAPKRVMAATTKNMDVQLVLPPSRQPSARSFLMKDLRAARGAQRERSKRKGTGRPRKPQPTPRELAQMSLQDSDKDGAASPKRKKQKRAKWKQDPGLAQKFSDAIGNWFQKQGALYKQSKSRYDYMRLVVCDCNFAFTLNALALYLLPDASKRKVFTAGSRRERT